MYGLMYSASDLGMSGATVAIAVQRPGFEKIETYCSDPKRSFDNFISHYIQTEQKEEFDIEKAIVCKFILNYFTVLQ